MREASRPTVKQELAAIRRGKTPVLSTAECRRFLRSISTDTVGGLRDRALVAVMTYSFARVSAALAMNVKDIFRMEDRLWLRLHEKGGKELEIPCPTTWNRISRPMSRRPGSTATAKVPSSAPSSATARFRTGASTGTAPGKCSSGAPGPPGSPRPSATTRSGQPASPRTSRTRRRGERAGYPRILFS